MREKREKKSDRESVRVCVRESEKERMRDEERA